MDAPTCRTCGKKHWSRVCDGDDDVTKRVTPVTKNVTPRDIVTATVTPIKQADLEIENRTLRIEVERLTTEVMYLKKRFADEHQKTVPVAERNRIAMTPAERQRKRRAKPG